MWGVFLPIYINQPLGQSTPKLPYGEPLVWEIPRVVNYIFLLFLSPSPPRCPLPPRRAVRHRSSTHRWSSLSMKTRRRRRWHHQLLHRRSLHRCRGSNRESRRHRFSWMSLRAVSCCGVGLAPRKRRCRRTCPSTSAGEPLQILLVSLVHVPVSF